MYRKLFFGLCLMVWALAAQAQTLDIRYFHGKQRCITCIAIENEMTLEQLQEVVFPHPTVSEIIKETAFTLK